MDFFHTTLGLAFAVLAAITVLSVLRGKNTKPWLITAAVAAANVVVAALEASVLGVPVAQDPAVLVWTIGTALQLIARLIWWQKQSPEQVLGTPPV